MTEPPLGRTRRVDRWVRQHPFIVVGVLALFLLTTAVELTQYGREAWEWWDRRSNWREHEYATLSGLHSEFTVERFNEALGAPLLRRESRNRRWVELAYRRREHWVQVVVPRGTGTAAFYAVTSCSKDFTPTFSLPDGESITLQRSTLAGVSSGDFGYASRYRYALWVSSPPSFIEYVTGPHAWGFKNFGWGLNGCASHGGSKVCGRTRTTAS